MSFYDGNMWLLSTDRCITWDSWAVFCTNGGSSDIPSLHHIGIWNWTFCICIIYPHWFISDLTWYFNSSQEPADPASSNELGHHLTMLGAGADSLSHATKRHKPGNGWWPLSLTSLPDADWSFFSSQPTGGLLDWLYIVCLVTSWDPRCILWFHHSRHHPILFSPLFYVEKETMELPLRIVKPLLYTGFHSYEKLPLLDKSPCCRPVASCKICDVQQLCYQTIR